MTLVQHQPEEGSLALSLVFSLIREMRRSEALTDDQMSTILVGVVNSTSKHGKDSVRELIEANTRID
jgi:hypothetical protein